MKRLFLSGLAAFLACICLNSCGSTHRIVIKEDILDNSLVMLKDFVIGGKDYQLGFASDEEVMQARIIEERGLDIFYVPGDSIAVGSWIEHPQVATMHRRMYPVYLGDQLHGCITFDSTSRGWDPIIFEDSKPIRLADSLMKLQAQRGDGSSDVPYFAVIESPTFEKDVLLEQDKNGSYIFAPPDLLAKIEPGMQSMEGTTKNIRRPADLFWTEMRHCLNNH